MKTARKTPQPKIQFSVSIPLNQRCIKCGKDHQFSGLHPVCLDCSSFKSKKFIKAFCFKCSKPIYERTPHVVSLQSEFTEFVCKSCFVNYRPRGETNYFKSCRNCKEYFYTPDDQQKYCTLQCYFSEKESSVDSSNSKTHALEKNEELMSEIASYQCPAQSNDNTSTSKNSVFF